MEKNPLVSVIMPVYNAEKFLEEAIESILKQTYEKFEFIIVNDGSTDKSIEIIKNYKMQDQRIVLIDRENKGLVYSLNEAISKANGKYIARMDSDDICLENRFEEQIKVLEENSFIDIVGCHYQLIDEESKIKKNIVAVPIKKDEILMTLCYSVPFAHPSVMIRKAIFKSYSYEENPTEDYLLWTKIYNGKNFRNIEKVLFLYRHQYGESFSDSKRIKMLNSEKKISGKFYLNNRELIENSLSILNNPNEFTVRCVVSLFFNINKSTLLKFFLQNPTSIVLIIKYVLRHLLREFFWKFKS